MRISVTDFADCSTLNCFNAAIRYGAKGVHVFPGRTSGDTKTPGVKHWKEDAATASEAIEALWRGREAANVLARTGPESGLFVLDVDVNPDTRVTGFKTLIKLEKQHGTLPDTLRQLTGSGKGGTQYFFKWPTVPAGYKLTISEGKDAEGNLLPGLDTRGANGYVVLPPSIHPESGGPYQWDDCSGPIADMPDWLLKLFLRPLAEPKADKPNRPEFHEPSSGYGTKAMREEIARLYAAPEGQRNSTLNRVAFSLGQLAAGLPPDTPERLYSAGIGIGLEDDETRRTIRSGWEAGLKEPRNSFNSAKAFDELPETFAATPFDWVNPATIRPRDWLYGRHLVRKYVSVTVAPGGIGKSSLLIAEALAMASGKPLLGQPVLRGPHNVWFYCLEDPQDELQRRVMAAAMQHEISAADCGGRLYVDSGRDQPLVMAIETRNGVEINRPCMDALEAELRARKIDALIVDPFVSCHQVTENDNNAIDRVAKEWAALADRTNTAISLVHHTRKLGGGEVTAESSRGGIALIGAARDVRVLNRMTEEEGLAAGVENHRLYFSVGSDKPNMAPPESKREWHFLSSVDLGNFTDDQPSDEVGAVVTWKWPDPFDEVSLGDLKAVQQAIYGKHYRANVQATRGRGWVGKAVAEHFGWDLESPSDKTKIKGILKTWIANKALKTVTLKDDKSGRDYQIIEVDQWA